jgi:hypothetical protein
MSELLSVWVESPAAWINSNQRLHRMAKAKLTAAWREAAAQSVPAGLITFDRPVRVVANIWKPRRGKYDPNNLHPTTKACVDGFVDAGLFVDDDWLHVIGPDHRHGGVGDPGIIFFFDDLLENAPTYLKIK